MFTHTFKDGEVYSCADSRNFKNYRNRKLLKKYGDYRTAYLVENDVDSLPICPYCGLRELIHVRYGDFKCTCGDKECIHKLQIECNREIARKLVEKTRENLEKWTSENSDVIKEYTQDCCYCGTTVDPIVKFDSHGKITKIEKRKHCGSKVCVQIERNRTVSIESYTKFRELAERMLTTGEDVCEEILSLEYGGGSYVDPEVNYLWKALCSGRRLWWNLQENRLELADGVYNYVNQYRLATPRLCIRCGEETPNGRKYCSSHCYWENLRDGIGLRDYSEEERLAQSERLKKMIRDGKFKPCVTSTFTHVKVIYDDIPYRSTWEAIFKMIQEVYGNTIEYEPLRVKYQIDGRWRNYIPDFVDTNNRIVYEIKPDCRMESLEVQLKDESLLVWCTENGYNRVFVSETYFRTVLSDDHMYDLVKEKAITMGIEFVRKYLSPWRKRKHERSICN